MLAVGISARDVTAVYVFANQRTKCRQTRLATSMEYVSPLILRQNSIQGQIKSIEKQGTGSVKVKGS